MRQQESSKNAWRGAVVVTQENPGRRPRVSSFSYNNSAGITETAFENGRLNLGCINCDEVVEDNRSVFISARASEQLGLREQRSLSLSGHYAHSQGVTNSGYLETSAHAKRNMLETLRLSEETKLTRQTIVRLVNATLELPDEFAPKFRDQLQHIRDIYGKPKEIPNEITLLKVYLCRMQDTTMKNLSFLMK